MTTTQLVKNNGKCDGCNDFDNDEKHPLTYISWVHHDPRGEEGWAYEDGERVKGQYCPDCMSSIRSLQRRHQQRTVYTVTLMYETEVYAMSESEALDMAFAQRRKLDVRDLRIKVDKN